jgi:hypothetical protein
MRKRALRRRYGHTAKGIADGTRVRVIRDAKPWAGHCGVVKMYQSPANVWVRLDPGEGARYKDLGTTLSFPIDRLELE